MDIGDYDHLYIFASHITSTLAWGPQKISFLTYLPRNTSHITLVGWLPFQEHAAPRRLININSQAKEKLLEGDGRCLSPTAHHLGKPPFAPGETLLQSPDSPPITQLWSGPTQLIKPGPNPQTFLSNPEPDKFLYSSEWDVSIMLIVLVKKIHWFSFWLWINFCPY